jgi:hypothetical protein
MNKLIMTAAIAGLLLTSSNAMANPLSGATSDRDLLYPGQSVTYNVAYNGGQRGDVAVVGDNDGDIDCFVYDNNWNLVVRDTRPVDGCGMYFTPLYTATFHIRLVNSGSDASVYTVRFY